MYFFLASRVESVDFVFADAAETAMTTVMRLYAVRALYSSESSLACVIPCIDSVCA